MVKVIARGRFSVYVYADGRQPHHAAHCHVYWADGAASVALLTLLVLDGDPFTASGSRSVEGELGRAPRRVGQFQSRKADPMSVVSRSKQSWDTHVYQRMRDVRYQAGKLVVEFEDGSRARVGVDVLALPLFPEPDWRRLTFDRYEIVVPTVNGAFEIPWDRVRVLTDPTYAAHLRAMAGEQNRIVGAKISALRQGQGMSPEALAEGADIPVATLADIEAGRVAASFSLLDRLLRPLGADLDALALEENAVP